MKQLRVADGPIEAIVLPEMGARLHRLRAFGHDLLRTPDDPAEHLSEPFFWGAYVMAPWCNRIGTGSTTIGRQTVRATPNFPDGSAIHGQVYARPWTAATGERRLRIHAGGDGWPWSYDVTLDVAVADATLRLILVLTSRSSEPMPAGLGLHPWWRRPLLLAVDAGSAYASNVAPGPRPEKVAGLLDLRRLGTPADGLDATWTDLGPRPIELAWPTLGIRATLRTSASGDHVVVATPPSLDAVAVEVQTHAPGGLQRLLRSEQGAMAMLEPGDELRLDVELAFRQE